MKRLKRTGLLASTILAAVATLSTVPASGAAHARASARARAARTISGADSAHLHLLHQDESLLFEEGKATGVLPGRMRAQLTVAQQYSGTCTIYTNGGSVTGHGVATPHGTGRFQSFSGTLSITGGTGRFRGAHGHTGLYGTFDRRTFSLVIQTTGNFSY
jgi:hypothetical protein